MREEYAFLKLMNLPLSWASNLFRQSVRQNKRFLVSFLSSLRWGK